MNDYCDDSCEPMEVDLSLNSNKSINLNCSSRKEQICVKREPINSPNILRSPSPRVESPINETETISSSKVRNFAISKPTRKESSYVINILSVLFVLLLSSFVYFMLNFNCNDHLDMKVLKKSLTKVHGQPEAITKIIEALESKASSKILFLYGGTGVGKTYASSLILENLINCSNTYHYIMPSFIHTFSSELMLGLTLCKSALFIVDDLTGVDMNIKAHIQDVITKSENLKKNITVILIYNCDNTSKEFVKTCDESFQKSLETNYKDIFAQKYFIKFDRLMEPDLKKCIENELADRRVNEYEMREIMKNFDVSLDGCKGVYNKMKFLNMKTENNP